MNSKNAVNAVLNHREPEYIPLGCYSIAYDTAERILGHETYVGSKIKKQIAIWEGRRDEVAQSLKEDSVELFRKLDCIDIILPQKEVRLLPPKDYVPPRVRKINENTWEDERGAVYRCSYLTDDITVVKTPPVEFRQEDFEGEPVVEPPDESIFEAYDYLVEHMKQDRFIAGLCGGFNVLVMLGSMEDGLMRYCLEPEIVKSAIRFALNEYNKLDEYYIKDGVDEIFIEEDLATTINPFISPAMFREFCLDAMKERIGNIKKHRSKVILHSCGNTWKYLDMFAEAGVDCYQSLQTGAGMDMKKLKELYGKQLCFWGGVSVENLIDGTPEDVRRDVRYAMQHGSPGGGFILGPSHSVTYGVKFDNFMAMLDEHSRLKYGFHGK